MQLKKQQLEWDIEQLIGSKLGCTLSPCLFNLYAESSSVQFSRSVVSNSLRPHESQHARPPCPSPTPGVYSCTSSRWCHPAISSSVIPFSSCPQSLSASGSFRMSQLFAWGGQSTGVSEYIMLNAGLQESQAGIKIARRNINLRYAHDTYYSDGRKWRGTKSLLVTVKEESEKTGLKLNIKKKIRSWHPVPSLHGK